MTGFSNSLLLKLLDQVIKIFEVLIELLMVLLFSRLVAFNLGYLPGGDKTIITVPKTTELALQAASSIVSSGGLISVLVYIGHPGGRYMRMLTMCPCTIHRAINCLLVVNSCIF